jgi:MtrB/PioB family decaheme-associated outer membrane protein
MSRRIGLLRTCTVGAALVGAGFVSTRAIAQEFYAIDPHVRGCCEGGFATGANAWTNGDFTGAKWPAPPPVSPDGAVLLTGAVPVAEPVPYWWTHGAVEVGYRGFTNGPSRNGPVYADQKSLAKYYEYSTIAPGMFGGGHAAIGSVDGLYQADIWANNIGYSDESYWLYASKAGEQYLSVVWDQTPHVYSTSALTPFIGAGTSVLTTASGPFAVASPANLQGVLHQQDIGIERNTAAVAYRWTPTEAWDIRADYSHMTREGSQVAGLTFTGFGSGSFQPEEHPAPVKDTTQDFGANGEYAGISPWGGKYSVQVAYNGSRYTDTISSYFVQNPFTPTLGSCTRPTAAAAGTPSCVSAQVSTPPSNSANGIAGTVAADLPLLSRYVGTVNYTAMRQDDTFQAMTNNPLAVASPFNGGANWNTLGALPTTSLNGAINTLLSNNVITTKILPDLTSKLSYRYYNFDNQTPRVIFPCWISDSGTGATIAPGGNPCGGPAPAGTGFENTISSLTIGYTKQDGGAALNWRPSREWNFNAEYGYQRYNYQQTDVSVTNENSGKLSMDWKPTTWFTVRASGGYGTRNYESYNYQQFVEQIQFPTVAPFTPQQNTAWFYAPAYQQFMFDHRQRTTANVFVDIVAFPGVTVTPTFKFKDDNYGLNPRNQEGVNDSRLTSSGVDVGWVVTRRVSFAVSYYWEYYDQTLYNYTNTATTSIFGLPFGWPFEAAPGNCTTGLNANCLITTSDRERVNTITGVANWTAIPDQLDLTVRYTVSHGVVQQQLLTAAPNAACVNCQGSFPDVTTLLRRLDATAIYKFDPFWVAQMGWTGDVKLKLRYTWESNSVANWANDLLTPFSPAISGTALWLGYNNPNYNVQMIAGSFITTW